MATIGRRGPRAAHVACAPSLSRIHERVFQALGLPIEHDKLGCAGVGYLSPPTFRIGADLELVRAQAVLYFAGEWLSKLDDGKSSSAKTQKAWERFEEAEQSCKDANQRLKYWRKSPWRSEITLASKLISSCLGVFSWDEAAKRFGWGPGATTRLPRRLADAAHKFAGNPHATIGAAILGNAVIRHSMSWQSSLTELPESEGVGYVKIVPGNRIVTVPKNYKTERMIAIEPDINIFVQLGIGGYIRQRLLRKGVDLRDQTRNQTLAGDASWNLANATIDLSMASDMISRVLVETLLPSDWAEALGQCRSPFGSSGDRKIFYHKYSSMGNGYTFELESLIFWALARAYLSLQGYTPDVEVGVYGDDLVIPSEATPGFLELIKFVGFKPNEKKSHWEDGFRESCGKHFYAGYDITPFYVKRPPKSLLDLFKIHNQIWRFKDRSVWLSESQVEGLQEVLHWLRGFAPAKWRRPLLVDGLGDGAFVGYFDEVLPQRAPNGHEGWAYRSLIGTPVLDDTVDGPGLLLKALYTAELRGSSDPVLEWLGLVSTPENSSVYPIKGTRYYPGMIVSKHTG